MKFIPLAALACLFATSCGSSGKKSTAATPAGPQALSSEDRFNKWATGMSKDNGYTKDANGNMVPRSDKRSSFENIGQDPNFTRKGIQKKEYRAGDYSRKSFWGNKEVGRTAYTGATDGSRFQQTNRSQGQGASESGTIADVAGNYDTGRFDTTNARETRAESITKGSNVLIEKRRKSYEQPEIISWDEQRKLSVNQSKGILGR